MNCIRLILCALFGLVASAAQAAVEPVPSLFSPDARFAQADLATAGTTLAAVGQDGATAVVDEAVVLTATLGARILIPALNAGATAPVVLGRGGFRIQSGSLPLSFTIGKTALRVERAEVLAVRTDQTWLVQVKRLFKGGKVELAARLGETSSADSSAHPGALPSAPCLLGDQQIAAVDPQGQITPDAAAFGRPLAELDRRLTAPPPRRAGLVPVNLELPEDIAVVQSDAKGEQQEIEVEAIEVEVGCVEVCVDG